MDWSTTLDSIRLTIGFLILVYASYTDIKTRRAANFLWVIMAAAGIALLIVQYFTAPFQNLWYLAAIPVMIVLFYGFYLMRLLYGGADAKALMALAILVPLQPVILTLPLLQPSSFWPGVWTIFVNSLIFFLIIPLSLLIYNAAHHNFQFPHLLLGYRMTVEKAKQNFVWPLEKIKDGQRKLSKLPQDFDVDKELEEFERLGITDIWVTPKIPFMIPLLVGFLATFIVGDILTRTMSIVIQFFTSLF